MPSKLLGLDLGSFSIKAASFVTTFKSFELTDLYESPPLQLEDVDPEDRAVIIKEALLRLLSDHNLNIPNVVTAIPGNLVSTRVLTLPLQEKQIEKVLPFELESQIPFSIDEILVDHHVILTSKSSTTCLAGAIKKSTLAEHLALLKSANLDPSFVGLDSLALFNLNQLPLQNEFGTYAIVDLGHQKTSVCIASGQQMKYVRTLFTAGRSVTESIQKALDLTSEQAVEVKHAHGILELENHLLQSKDLRRLSAAIRQALDPLFRELVQTLQAYRAQYSQTEMTADPVQKIFLCGGSSLIRNLPEYLESLTQVQTRRLSLFNSGDEGANRLGERQPVLAQAVALGLRVASRGARAENVASLNFRKGEFAYARDLSGIKDKAIFFSRWALVIFLLALVHQGIRYQNLARQNAQIEKSILRIFNEIVPNEPQKPKNASAAVKTLEARTTKLQQQEEILTAGLNEMTALGILNLISQKIPSDVPMDTQELTIEKNLITLGANTDSFASVDRIISALQDVKGFRKIDKGASIRESADGKKAFQLKITVGEAENEKKPQTARRKG